MATYVSTLGGAVASFADAVFEPLAPDGGLWVPSPLPNFPDPAPVHDDFTGLARWAAPSLVPGTEPSVLRAAAAEAFTFDVGLLEVDPGVHVLELFHGPTCAFKDFGARFMAAILPRLEPPGSGGAGRTVLVATSGDTGGAVADAFHGVDGVRVVVLFPAGAVSERQRRQMTTLGGNVRAFAVEGSFDDCQRMAKEAFRDAALSAAHGLTSANSINVARLLPQALYYVWAAAHLGPAHFVVPSGNLGNLCAGLLAARAGTPVRGFTAAVNANRGIADFLRGSHFEPRSPVPTTSTAMDVGAPSNLERIRWLYAGDDEALRRDVQGDWVGDADVAGCIARVHARTGYVMDPHTAVAYEVATREDAVREGPVVVLSTAHPAKFPETVETVIGRPIPLPDSLAARLDMPERMSRIAPTLVALARALDAPS